MMNNYNLVKVTSALRIISLLAVLLFTPLSGTVSTQAATFNHVSENETDPAKASNVIINPGLDPMISLSSNSAYLSAAANSTAEVNVTSNTTWTATVLPSIPTPSTWLHVSPATGNGNGTLTFTADANTDKDNPRSASVLIRSTGVADQTILVTQSQEIPSITFTSKASGFLAINLQFNLGGTFYIDWGNGTQESQPASTLGQSYSTTGYISGKTVKVYGSGITNIVANSSSLETLNVSECKDLISLSLSRNNIEVLDLIKNTNLTFLDCSYNELTSLDVSKNTQLTNLVLSYNELTALDLTFNTNLTTLSCISNKLTSLDLSSNPQLTTLHCYLNKLNKLIVSSNMQLKLLYCYSNNLTFGSLPQAKTDYTTYNYAPQAKIQVSLSGNVVDISSEQSATDMYGVQYPTVYKWYLKGAGTQLVKGTDYLESNGVFTFLKTTSDSVYCAMTNPALPELKNSYALRTNNLKVLLVMPAVSTIPVSDVEVNTATGNGNITDLGMPNPTEYGVVWSTSPSPTIDLLTKTIQSPVTGLGTFTSTIEGLAPATTYYVRAYVTNLAGTAYGFETSFTTKGLKPTVTTQDVDNIGTTVARGNGTIVDLGVPNPTEYGVVWSTSTTPTTDLLTRTKQGGIAVAGPFTSNITGLTSNTIYYVRAYAKNDVETVYGNEVTFTTLRPTIDIQVPVPLVEFTTLIGTASASQTFTVGGKLEADLVVTAPTGYEVRENGTGVFGPTVLFTPIDGVVPTKTIEVRIASTTLIGTFAGNVVCSSVGAIDQTVAVTGIVSAIQLTIADPILTKNKVYDGTPKAEATSTLVTGIDPGDDVLVVATATYADSNVGPLKDITVKYSLTGITATKYLPPVDFLAKGDITKAPVTVTAVTDTKIYDGTVSSDEKPLIGALITGEVFNVEPTQVYDNANAGSAHVITASGLTIKNAGGIDVTGNYDITYQATTATGVIDPLAVNVTALTDTKNYDGTTVSAAAPSVGVLATGDVVNAAPTQVYDTPEIGTTHVMTASGLTINNAGGTDVTGNYTITYLTSVDPGIINKAVVTVTAVTDTKTYDGNTLSDDTPLVGALIPGDVVNALPSQVYDNANAGTNHLMIASGLTIKNGSGTDVTGNYDINYVASVAPGVINPLDVSVTAVTETKTYNGKATSAGVPVVGALITGDVVDLAPIQVFDNANVGINHVMSASGMTLKNAGNVDVTNNYNIIYQPSVSPGIITPLGITVTAVPDTKIYDANVSSIALPLVGALAGGDMVNIKPTQVFDDLNVGIAHVLTASGLTIKNALDEDVTTNYDITYLASAATGIINPLTVKVTAVTETKIYDGTTVSIVNPIVGALAGSDAVNAAPTQVYDTPVIGTTHVMTASGLTIKNAGGTDVSGNYTIAYLPSLEPGIINKAVVTVTPVTDTKTYDGTTTSDGNPGVGILIPGDVVNALPTQVYDNANAGTNHLMIASGLTIKNGIGDDVTGNYDINYVASVAPGIINPYDVTVTAVTETKTYNGNATSAGVPVVGILVTGDVISAAPIQVFDNANVGINHVMSASGMTLKNAGSVDVTNNYNIIYQPSVSPGIITPLGITVTAVPDTKIYDANVSSIALPLVGAMAGGDVVNFKPTQVFDDVNIGIAHVLTASGLTIKNALDEDVTTNYDITYLASAATGIINPLTVNVTAVTETKIYDGTTVSIVNPIVGALAGSDAVNAAPTQVYDTPVIGTTHVMTASGLTIKNAGGTDVSGNYTIAYLPSLEPGIINKAVVTVTPVTDTKTYDGTTTSDGNPGVGILIPGDVVNALPTQVYDNANAGTTHTMIASGLTIKNGIGDDVTGNYDINYVASVAPGIINPFDITVTAVTETKTYNGKVTSDGVPVVGALITGDVVDIAPIQVYDNANVGINHIMSASGMTLKNAGNVDVTNNYNISYLPSVSPGVITPLGITVTAVPDTKIYNGNVSSTALPLVGVMAAGDVVKANPTQVYDDLNVGTAHVMTASGLTIKNAGEVDVTDNYAISYLASPASGVITPKLLTVDLPDLTISKVYDGSTKAEVTPGILSGVEPLDIANVKVTAAADYDNAAVNTGKTITVTYALIGSAAANYVAPANYSVSTGIIEGKPLTAGIPVITNSRTYDGTVYVEVTPGTLSGVDAADVGNLELTATATFDNANAATGKTIKVTYGLRGSAAPIYSIPADYIVTNGEIKAKSVSVTDPVITSVKIYNGTTLADVKAGELSGVVVADIPKLFLGATATYDNANVGVGKTITCTYTLTGSAAGNYVVPSDFIITTGEITGKSISVTAPVITTFKVYDGTTKVNITPGIISGLEAVDLANVELTATANYDNINVGKDKTITITYALIGSAAGNYTTPAGFTLTTGEIVGMPVTVSDPLVKLSKVYDGKVSADVTPGTLSGIAPLDIPNLELNAIASYDNAKVGNGKTIMVVYQLTGSASSIYAVPSNFIVNTGEITARALTASDPSITISKVYDATTFAEVTSGILYGVVGTDDVSLNSSAKYDNINVGNGKNITCSYTISGVDATNYLAPSDFIEAKGIIVGKMLTVLSVKQSTSKVYNGTDSASFSVESFSGIEPIDMNQVDLTGKATYDNANAGTGKNVTVVYKLAGPASGNYVEPTTYTITNGVILAKLLTITKPVVVTDKMYDGITSAVITTLGSLNGVEPIDTANVNVTAVANYDTREVGINKTIEVVYTLDGLASTNYTAPVSDLITNSKISDIVTLDQLITSSTGCEGSTLDLGYTILTGTPTQFKITFNETALAAGLLNVNYTNLSSFSTSDVLPVTIPKGTKDGVYQGTIQMRNELGIESPVYSFQFTINVSSDFIIAKFDDVVLCDNKSNHFTGYQWYKDGVEIKGATKQFYNDLDGLIGSYSLKLTTVDGETLYTCAKVLNIPLIKKITVYPNPLKVNQPATIQMTGLSNEDLVGAELSVYSMQGICVYQSTKVEKTNSIYLPSISGMYLGNVKISTGQVFPFKIIVSK